MTGQDKKKSWVHHTKLALRKRWVQVCLLVLVWGFAVALSWSSLAPKKEKRNAADYKFLHCEQCKTEMPFNLDLDGKRCPKCQPPKTGFLVPTVESIKTGSELTPWRWLYLAVFVECVCLLGGVVYLLYLPVADPKSVYYVLPCPHCGQRLRYRGVSLGQLGSCARCKRMIRFPEEEEALPEAELVKLEEEAARELAAQAQAEADAQAEAEEQAAAEAEAQAYAQAQAEAEAQAQAEAEAAAQAEAEERSRSKTTKRRG